MRYMATSFLILALMLKTNNLLKSNIDQSVIKYMWNAQVHPRLLAWLFSIHTNHGNCDKNLHWPHEI